MHPDRDLNWYVKQKMLMGEKRTAQEIDCDFLQSGYTVFDVTKLREIEERLNDGMYEDYKEYLGGDLRVYYDPEPHTQYVIGADVSANKARDYSTFSIMSLEGL